MLRLQDLVEFLSVKVSDKPLLVNVDFFFFDVFHLISKLDLHVFSDDVDD